MTGVPRGKIEFRIVTDHDKAFLFKVYASTREWEFVNSTWTDQAKRGFLDSQFKAQSRAYEMNYVGAVHRIIQLDATDIGILRLNRQDHQLYIIDFALLPEYRGRGIGSDILKSLVNEAHGGKVPVRLQAERGSPAVAFYERHGFRATHVNGHHVAMEWQSRPS